VRRNKTKRSSQKKGWKRSEGEWISPFAILFKFEPPSLFQLCDCDDKVLFLQILIHDLMNLSTVVVLRERFKASLPTFEPSNIRLTKDAEGDLVSPCCLCGLRGVGWRDKSATSPSTQRALSACRRSRGSLFLSLKALFFRTRSQRSRVAIDPRSVSCGWISIAHSLRMVRGMRRVDRWRGASRGCRIPVDGWLGFLNGYVFPRASSLAVRLTHSVI
jgi:hypothetical protein